MNRSLVGAGLVFFCVLTCAAVQSAAAATRSLSWIATGTGYSWNDNVPPQVKVFVDKDNDNRHETVQLEFPAAAAFHSFRTKYEQGATVALTDITGDGRPDILAGTTYTTSYGGPSYPGANVLVIDGRTGSSLPSGLAGGGGRNLYIAAARSPRSDANYDGVVDVPVALSGGHPIVVRDAMRPSWTPHLFYFDPYFDGYNEPVYRVAMGDMTGDGVPDIVTASGPGDPFGNLDIFDGTDGRWRQGFGTYGANYVAAGDVNGDGIAEIIAAADQIADPTVWIIDPVTGGRTHFSAFPGEYEWQSPFRGGVRVAAADVNGDGHSDIIAAQGPRYGGYGGGLVRVFDGVTLVVLDEFYPYGPSYTDGIYVAAAEQIIPEPSALTLVVVALIGICIRYHQPCRRFYARLSLFDVCDFRHVDGMFARRARTSSGAAE